MAHNPSYVGPRDDILALVPAGARRVLDVGCSVGTLGDAIKRRNGAWVTGVEMDPEMAELARSRLDRVVVGDVEALDLEACSEGTPFDCICLADVLEHLRDPWRVLAELTEGLVPGGTVVASIPNIRHYSTLASLLFRGYWPYRERGIHDRTHLRFFTLRNIRELFSGAGLEVNRVQRKYRILERPSRINRVSRFVALPPFRDLWTFQYLVRATKAPRP